MTASAKPLSPRWQYLLPLIALGGAVFLAYANVYGNDFLFDDGLTITLNSYLLSWTTLGKLLTSSTTAGAHIAGGFYRPMQMLLYFLLVQLFGQSIFAFHLLNVAIHAANGCLILTLGRKLQFNPWASFLAALIWVLHPIHTEAVTYMSATADPLFTFFCLLGLIVLLPDFTLKKILLSLPIFIFGLLSKETAVVFPLLVTATLYYVSPTRLKFQTYLRIWPLIAVMALYLIWRLTVANFDGPASYERLYQLPEYHNLKLYADHFSLRFYTFMATLPAYLTLLLWPEGLHMERSFMIFVDFSPPVLEGIALCLSAILWVILVRGPRGRPLSWGLLWFASAHAPDTGLLVAGNSLFLEHWMYLPTAGLFLGGAESLARLLKPRQKEIKQVAKGLGLTLAALLGFLTFIQNRVWHDPVTFYTHIFKYGGESARAHNNLALAYMDKREFTEAIAEFHKAIDLSDTYAETRNNLAVCLLNLPNQQEHIKEAIDNLHRALEIDPNFVRSYVILAQVYKYLGDADKAAANQRRADELLNGSGP